MLVRPAGATGQHPDDGRRSARRLGAAIADARRSDGLHQRRLPRGEDRRTARRIHYGHGSGRRRIEGKISEIHRIAEVRGEEGNTVLIRVAINKDDVPNRRNGAVGNRQGLLRPHVARLRLVPRSGFVRTIEDSVPDYVVASGQWSVKVARSRSIDSVLPLPLRERAGVRGYSLGLKSLAASLNKSHCLIEFLAISGRSIWTGGCSRRVAKREVIHVRQFTCLDDRSGLGGRPATELAIDGRRGDSHLPGRLDRKQEVPGADPGVLVEML